MNSLLPWRLSSRRSLAFAAAALTLGGLSARAADSTAVPAAAGTAVLAVTRLSRDEAVALALRHNQRIKVSEFNPAIARANLLQQYGRFDPAITFRRSYREKEVPSGTIPLTASLTKTDDYSLSLDGLAPWGMTYQIGATANNERGTANQFTDQYVTFGGVSVTQPLLRGFGFGANLADLRIAKANRAISDWQHRQTVIDTITNTLLAYDGLAYAREYLRIARYSRELNAQLLANNERRNQLGSMSDADVTQARARLASREEIVIRAERAVKDAENVLRQLIGEGNFSANGPELVVDALVPAATVAPDGAADYRRALELRPDYQAAKQGVVKSKATSSAAWNQLLPRVDFVGSYGYNGVDGDFARSRAQVRAEDHRAYSAGVVVSVPLTFAEGRGRARAAKLALKQSEADLTRLEQDIAIDIAAAVGQLDTTAKRVEAATRAVNLAQQALDAEQKRFQAGTSNTYFVLQQQTELNSAQISQIAAVADQRRAVANYQREIGVTLDVHGIRLQ